MKATSLLNPQTLNLYAYNELWRRLHEKDGKNPCADFFGGIEKAEKALKETKFSFGPLEQPGNAQTIGNNVRFDPTGDFMNTSGYTNIQVGLDVRSGAWQTITLTNIQAAAFIMLHELGHRTKSFGDRDQDGGGSYAGVLNNDEIRKACFPEASP